jgi:hypothetical protein
MEGFLQKRPFYYQHFQPTALHFQDLEGRQNPTIPLVSCISGRDMHDWETIVENYSAKALTDKADKLAAISAIAEIYQMSNADEYLAGLWKKDVLPGLMWRVGMTNGPRQDRQNTKRLPGHGRPCIAHRLGHGSRYIPWITGYFSVVLHPAVSH